jgi:hypothetical protein
MHLSEIEAIDAAEGALTGERAAHAASCERCRLVVERLSAALHEARALDVPDPSPIFWNAFSAHVLDAIEETRGPASSRPSWPLLAWRPALAAAVFFLIVIVAIPIVRPPQVEVRRDDSARLAVPSALEPAETIEADPEWMLLASVADGIEWDAADAVGFGLRPGSADRAVEQLSREEQLELERLLRVAVSDRAGAI